MSLTVNAELGATPIPLRPLVLRTGTAAVYCLWVINDELTVNS